MGIHKSSIRKKLEKIDLTFELTNFTLKEIAKRYGTSVRIVHTVLTEQIEHKISQGKRSFNDLDSGFENKMINAVGTGAWMLSKERKALRKHKNSTIE